MARIAGVDLPRDKRVEIGLTYIYGIGRKTADDIIAATGVNPDTRVRDLTEEILQSSENTSSITAALKVTFAVTSLMILKDLLILVVTVAFATEKDFL